MINIIKIKNKKKLYIYIYIINGLLSKISKI